MDSAAQQYFDMMEALFTQPGWKLLSDDIQGWKDAIASQWRTVKPEDLRYEQGRYDGLCQITEYFGQVESAKAQLLEQEAQVADPNSMGFGDV